MAMAHGERHPSAKLTVAKVKELRRVRREEKLSYAKLAQRFGISTRSAWLIVNGFHWKHVKDPLPDIGYWRTKPWSAPRPFR